MVETVQLSTLFIVEKQCPGYSLLKSLQIWAYAELSAKNTFETLGSNELSVTVAKFQYIL
jgi:hypothetical protein